VATTGAESAVVHDCVVCHLQVTYRIKAVGSDYDKFSIDRETGVVRTTASFDREIKNEYYITVIAEDGAPSNRSNHYPPGTPNRGATRRLFCVY